jgi:hypothetical protein
MGAAYVGIVEWWLKNGMPYPPHVMEDQVGILRGIYHSVKQGAVA